MNRSALPLVLLAATLSSTAAFTDDLDRLLTFEGSSAGSMPAGWGGGPADTLFADSAVVHGGSWAARIERAASGEGFRALTTAIPLDFAGKTRELHGWLKTENVQGRAGIWMREDSESGSVAFDNMQQRKLEGTTEWTEYTIKLPLEKTGVKLFFGALLAGKGNVLVDGEPIAQARKVHQKTPLDTDHEFDAGSKVEIDAPTPTQIASLATLGRVWGFLKYHHPKVVAGEVHWDYELFRAMPSVLAAADRKAANKAILTWARKLGDITPCDPCATLPEGLALSPDVDWIHDRAALGEPLATYLDLVHRNRPKRADQAYVAPVEGVGNPEFRREPGYPRPAVPDAGYRILALLRWWNAVQYWSPYRDVIGADWNAVLPEFLPRLIQAKDVDRYHAEMFALVSRLNDGHANLWSTSPGRPPAGACQVPVTLRWIEGRPVVTGYSHAERGPATKLEIGDTIQTIDGKTVDQLMASWKPLYSASNDAYRALEMMGALTRGPCGSVKLTADRTHAVLDIKIERQPRNELKDEGYWTHDLPGPAFRLLSRDIAYLKLSGVAVAEIPRYLEKAKGTKGWIIDIRNYPKEFVVFALGRHFVSEPTPFVRFTIGDPSNPGAFKWTDPPLVLRPVAPRYAGRLVILVDETTMSSAEYTSMAFRAAPNAIVIGSTTAGADGNTSKLPLPGGLASPISGIGVFYPDKKPTQRVGIVPDIEVEPTIAGIRERRDEVLEAALRQILGAEVSAEQIRALVR